MPERRSLPRGVARRPSNAHARSRSRPPDTRDTTPRSTLRRTEARDLGIRAERAAQTYLLEQGFAILGANLRVGRYEIDLLARDRSVVVVVEVRARGPGSLVRPLDTIDARKRARLRAAAERLWRDRFAKDRAIERVRFDCIAVTIDAAGGTHVEHVRAAF